MRCNPVRGMLGALLLAAAILPVSPAGAATLVRGFGDSWQSLDPQVSETVKDSVVLADLYEGLVGIDAAGKPTPGAAASWEISPDGLSYVFHLRRNLRWANGQPLRAADFLNGMRRLLDPATASSKAYYLISTIPITGAGAFNAGKNKDFSSVGIKAADDFTIAFTLDRPQPHTLDLLNFYLTTPLPHGFAGGSDFVDPAKGFANGAFMLQEVVPQSHLLLVRNPNYWDVKHVALDGVRFQVTEDVNTELKLFQTGAIDITSDVPADQLATLRREMPDEVRLSPIGRSLFLSFNVARLPLSDRRVREALSLAIDRNALENKVMRIGDIPILSYVPLVDPSYPRLTPGGFGPSQAANLARAKSLLAEAGYGRDKSLTVNFYCFSDRLWRRRAEAITVMWRQYLGVVAKLHFQDSQAHWDSFAFYDWDVYCDSLSADYPSAEPLLVFRMDEAGNGYQWLDKSFEELMHQAMREPDKAQRNTLLARAEQILLDDHAVAPLISTMSRRLISKRVSGWVDNPINYHLSKYLSVK